MMPGVLCEKMARSTLKVVGVLLLSLLAAALLTLGSVVGTASAALKKDSFTVSDGSGNQKKPSVGGSFVVWEDDRDGNSAIYAKNLKTGAEFVVVTGVGIKREPVTNGSFVVWEDDRNGDSDIYARKLGVPSAPELLIAGGAGDQRKPAISGNTVIWQSKNIGTGKWEVYRHDLTSQNPPSKIPVVTGGTIDMSPAISGDTIVWQDDRDGNSAVYAKNLATGKEFRVSSSTDWQDQPAISGSIAVWRQNSVNNYDIFGKDLYAKNIENGEVFQITTDSKDQVSPAISGSVVVWEDHRNGKAEIYAKDLSTNEEFQVTAPDTSQTGLGATKPAISGETVVWESQYDGPEPNYGNYDIQGAGLEAPPGAPTRVRATGSLNGVFLKWDANIEADLAGYNVYRRGSVGGAFTKLNQSLLSSPSFSDADAPKGFVSYYQIEAVDVLGNKSLPSRTSAAAIARSSVSLSASPTILEYGGATVLSGKLTSEGKVLSGKQIIIEQRPAGGRSFSAISRRTTNSDGTFRLGGLRPKRNTLYRARFVGERNIRGSSARQTVKVKAKVSLKKPDIPRINRNINITGRVNTARNGKVTVVIRRNGKVVVRKIVSLVNFNYRSAYKVRWAGKYTVQVIVPNTRTNMANTVRRSFSAGQIR